MRLREEERERELGGGRGVHGKGCAREIVMKWVGNTRIIK